MTLQYPVNHRPCGNRLGLEAILADVCKRHRVSRRDILAPGPCRRLSIARHEAFVLAYATGKYSLPSIGAFFNRDHTTVLHAIKKARAA